MTTTGHENAKAASKSKDDGLTTPSRQAPAGRTSLTEPSTLHPFDRLHRRMDDILEEFSNFWPSLHGGRVHWPLAESRTPDASVVRFDLSENRKAVTITAEVPGMNKDDVQIEIDDGVLIIKGEKKSEREEKDENYYLSERRFGSFQRAFRMPDGIDGQAIKASFDKGVLSIVLPKDKTAKSEPRTVKITANK